VSLLDRGPDEVTVFAEVEETDSYGNRILTAGPTGVAVRGRWQPSTASETADLGQQTETVYRFITRDFPAGPYGRVVFDNIDWDVIAEPRLHRGSPATRHVTVYLKER
jgi:hypothetical protein